MVTLSKDPQGSLVKNREERLDDIAIQYGNAVAALYRHRIGCLECWAKCSGYWSLQYSGSELCEKAIEMESEVTGNHDRASKAAWELMSGDRERFVREGLLAKLTARTSVEDLDRLVKLPEPELRAILYPPPPPKPAPVVVVTPTPATKETPAPDADVPF